MRRAALVLLPFLSLAACGGPPQPGTPGAGSAAPPSSAAPAATDDHADYMKECVKDPGLRDYCECGYGVFAKSTTAAERQNGLPQARVGEVTMKTRTECGGKLPEDLVKRDYMNGCAPEPSMTAWCECGWVELRKGLQPVDFLSPELMETPKYRSLEEGMIPKCASKMPETRVKADFIGGCSKGDPGRAVGCECLYTEIRKSLSLEKFITSQPGTPEVDDALKKAKTACEAKKPGDTKKPDDKKPADAKKPDPPKKK